MYLNAKDMRKPRKVAKKVKDSVTKYSTGVKEVLDVVINLVT